MAKKLKSVVPYFQSLMKNDVRQVSTEIAVPAPLTSTSVSMINKMAPN